MTPRQFNFIIEVIKDHPVFERKGRKPQADIVVQLKVALHVLAHDGSHASDSALARILAVSVGSMENYYKRCVIALCSKITMFLRWPDREKKAKIKEAFGKKGFPDVIGAIDGTTLPFYRAPSLDKDSWITRNGEFAMGATAICDDRSVFIYFGTGYPGSCHDSSAFKCTNVYKKQHQHFEGKECMIGDVAYGLTTILITGFKGETNNIQKEFNHRLSSARMTIEHAFGLLKGRWKSLSCLRVHIITRQDIDLVSMHISACVVLHNLLKDPEICDVEYEELILRREMGVERRIPLENAIERDEAGGEETRIFHEEVERVLAVEEQSDDDVDQNLTLYQRNELRKKGVEKRRQMIEQVLRKKYR